MPCGSVLPEKLNGYKFATELAGRTRSYCAPNIFAPTGRTREKSFPLPERQSVHRNLGARQLHCNLTLQFFERVHALGFQLDEHRAMEQRLSVLAEVGEKLHHILQISFGFNGFVDIVAAGHGACFAGSVLNDFLCSIASTSR